MFDMSQIDKSEFHVDLGFMYGVPSQEPNVSGGPRIGYTALPRQCCLKAFVKRFNDLIPDAKGSLKIKGTHYTWGLTKDVGSLTIDFPPRHPFRELGLSYIQIYPSHKNLFNCESHYPYPLDDDTGVCLAMDSHTLKSLFSVVSRPMPNLNFCRTSWRSSGSRIGVPLQSHSNRSFYVRMELRVTETLRQKICSERRRQRQTQSVQDLHLEGGCPFYIHETKVINNFMTASTQVLARLFQEIVSLAPEGCLSIDHQKLLVQIFQLQKVAHSAVLLPKFKYLYNSVVRIKLSPQGTQKGVEQPREKMGLGLKETIQSFGYGYPKHGLIDWVELNFAGSHIAEQFPHPSHALCNIKARPEDRRRLNDLFEEIDFVIGRLRMERDEGRREILLDWLVMRLIKQFHIDILIYMIKGPYQFVNKERHVKTLLCEDEDDDEDENSRTNVSSNQKNDAVPQKNQLRSRSRRARSDSDYELDSSESEVRHFSF